MEMTFEEWMAEVDHFCYAKAGLSIYDLPDCCFRDWYDDGMSPRRAAADALRETQE